MIQSDTIRQAIRNKLTEGKALKTVGGAEFVIESITPLELVFRVGEKKSRVAIQMNTVDDLVKEFKFLPPNGWMKIGATTGQPKAGTLAAVVREHTTGASSASQFAAVLAFVGVAEINPRRPARIRLLV
ncbi:MAG: hypothetical protein ACFFBR_10740 [Promethearchaeota archaeon]